MRCTSYNQRALRASNRSAFLAQARRPRPSVSLVLGLVCTLGAVTGAVAWAVLS